MNELTIARANSEFGEHSSEEIAKCIGHKYERDIDTLLAEEFAVSPAFATWFLQQTNKFKDKQDSVSGVFLSKTDPTGESDLVVVFGGPEHRFALHIEDKIDAPVQPEQPARYRLRAEKERMRGDYSEYEVVLCSPEAYCANHSEAASFDSAVSYEMIERFLRAERGDLRSAYRADFIASAVRKSSNQWEPTHDEQTNYFWETAYEIATKEFPELNMREPKVSKDCAWITFRPQDMPTQPRWVYVSMKGDRGFMDLTFGRCLSHLLSPQVSPLLDSDMTIHQTGKSAAIRIRIDGFKVSEINDDARCKLRGAFAACVRLIRFYRQHREKLDLAASKSSLSWVTES